MLNYPNNPTGAIMTKEDLEKLVPIIIENDFRDELGINLTIHIDPVLVGDVKTDKIYKQILEKLQVLDKKGVLYEKNNCSYRLYGIWKFSCY